MARRRLMDRLYLVDRTLCAGHQTPGVAFTTAEKLALAGLLDGAGVALADAGLPTLGEDERAFLRAAVDTCESMVVGASVDGVPDQVHLALGCGVGAVFVRCAADASLDDLGRCAERIHSAGATLELVVADSSRDPAARLEQWVRAAVTHGAARIYLVDSVGPLTPARVAARVGQALAWADGQVTVGLDCTNELGMATANTVAGVEAGARWPMACVNGLGAQTGTADLGAVALACSELLGLETGFEAAGLQHLARAVELASGQLIPAQAPLVGQDAFRHQPRVAPAGGLQDPRTLEFLDPAAVGAVRTLILGPRTDGPVLRSLAADAGITLGDEALAQLQAHLQQQAQVAPREATKALGDALARHTGASAGLAADQFLALARLMGEEG
jgi:isopropylmalate/homocitrate/citramalate synthase